jgi:isopenicillin N synthase-like dioxygenase
MTRLQNNANFAQTIDITQIFGNNAASRRAVYQNIGDVLSADGVFVAVGLPDGAQLQRHANALLRFFELSGEEKLRLATRRVRADSRRSYRGFVATLTEGWAYNEFFDIGLAISRSALLRQAMHW